MIHRIALIAATAALLSFSMQAADAPAKTGQLISVLQSNASLFEKARACQQLGEIGGRDAVPVLAALLSDEHLSAYARSGLEGIPDPSAAAALREVAARLKGPLLVGAVNSLGALRDGQAVELLRQLAADSASGAVKEALLALGSIASPPALQALRQALSGGSETARADAAAACLLAADRQKAASRFDEAVALCDQVRDAQVPLAFRVGATRGAIIYRQTGRVPFLVEQLGSGEPAIRNAALLAVREIPDEALATALNAELVQAKPEMQSQLLLAIADCHNSQSISAVETLLSSARPETRKTALAVLGRLGPGAAPVLLTALKQDPAAENRSIILNGLKGLKGTEVDDQLQQALNSATQPRLRVDLIRLLGDRGTSRAGGELLKQAAGADQEASLAALSVLPALVSAGELPKLVILAKSSHDKAVREAAEDALAAACSRSDLQSVGGEAVLAELKQASLPADKIIWIRVLAAAGYPKALPTLEAAASDPDSEVAATALAQLGRWPDPAPIETLLHALDNRSTPALKERAVGAVIDLAATATDESQRPGSVIAEWLERGNAAATSLPEKRRILGILGRLKAVESYRLLSSCLDDPGLRNEAAAGLVQIAPAVADEVETGALQASLGKVASTVANADLKRQALQASKTIADLKSAARLFDGRSLDGWEGDTQVWRVRDQVIVGGSLQGNPRNEFLATTRAYTNFLLRLEYKLIGTEGFVNSGVQFRSARVSNPPNEMIGYQADIGAGHSGCLYDESRRNNYLARCGDDAIKRLEKPGDWNRYEVRCEGSHIQIWLNGEKTVDYTETDPSIPQAGLFGLQIHGGNKAEVSFRNITVREF